MRLSGLVRNAKTRNGKLLAGIATAFIIVAAIIFVVAIYKLGESDTNVTVADGKISISGMYGFTFDVTEVAEITLIDKSMNEIGAGRRVNGYGGFGDTLKGHFDSGALGKTMLFVNANASPTVFIDRKDADDVYISYRDGAKTAELYEKLVAALG